MRGVVKMDSIALTINDLAECEQAKDRIHEPEKFSKLVMDEEDGKLLVLSCELADCCHA